MRRPAWVAVVVGLLVGVAASRAPVQPAPAAHAPSHAAEGTFAREVERLDALLVPARGARRATLLTTRARLTGDWADLVDAGAALEGAPPLARAEWAFTVHRLEQARAALEVVVGPDADLLRAAVALADGRYAEARAAFDAIEAVAPSSRLDARFAVWFWQTGHLGEARDRLVRSGSAWHGRERYPPAWTALTLGRLALEEGDVVEAWRQREVAAATLTGWWETEAFAGEILVATGKPEAARARYEAAVAQVADPDAMLGLADACLAAGDGAAARDWATRAGALYAERLAVLPEAAAGHAVQWAIRWGDPAEAVALAEANVAARGGGEGWHLLAEALLAAGRVDEAVAAIRHVEGTPYDTAAYRRAAMAVYEAAGEPAKVAEHRAALGERLGHVHGTER